MMCWGSPSLTFTPELSTESPCLLLTQGRRSRTEPGAAIGLPNSTNARSAPLLSGGTMNIKNLRASGPAVRALNDLADEITVTLQTDQALTDDERRDLNEALDEAVHLVVRIEKVTS